MRWFRKPVGPHGSRGFKSLPLRQPSAARCARRAWLAPIFAGPTAKAVGASQPMAVRVARGLGASQPKAVRVARGLGRASRRPCEWPGGRERASRRPCEWPEVGRERAVPRFGEWLPGRERADRVPCDWPPRGGEPSDGRASGRGVGSASTECSASAGGAWPGAISSGPRQPRAGPRTARGSVVDDVTVIGEVTEWPIVHAWKACVPHGTVGSNPTLSANPRPPLRRPRLVPDPAEGTPRSARRCRLEASTRGPRECARARVVRGSSVMVSGVQRWVRSHAMA